MNRYEFRVVWKRRGMHQKSKRYANLKAAERRVLLMGPEPWLALELEPDAVCCSGLECGCGGRTNRERLLGERLQTRHPDEDPMPPIEYMRIERRPQSAWEPMPNELGKEVG